MERCDLVLHGAHVRIVGDDVIRRLEPYRARRLRIFRALHDRNCGATAAEIHSTVLCALGEAAAALPHAESAAATYRELGFPHALARILCTVGRIHAALGEAVEQTIRRGGIRRVRPGVCRIGRGDPRSSPRRARAPARFYPGARPGAQPGARRRSLRLRGGPGRAFVPVLAPRQRRDGAGEAPGNPRGSGPAGDSVRGRYWRSSP
jgi:hypothetical protein